MSEKKKSESKKVKSNEFNNSISATIEDVKINESIKSVSTESASGKGTSAEGSSCEGTSGESPSGEGASGEGASGEGASGVAVIDTSEPISIDYFRNLTNSAKEKNSNKFNEELNIAMQDAVKDITNDCYEKMKTAAENGYSRCDLKKFMWCDDKDAKVDCNGSKITFGKFKMKDFIDPRRGKEKFMPLLNNFFNKDLKETDNKYHCGYRKNTDETTGKDVWSIYVSWEPYIPRNDENSSFARGGRGGRGIGGRGPNSFQGRGRGRSSMSSQGH